MGTEEDDGVEVDRMVKNIIFDMGRVLVTFDPVQYVNSLGFDEETARAVVVAIFHNPLWTETDRGVIPVEEFEDAFVANAPKYETQIRKAYREMGRIIQLMPHTMPWVKELKERGYRLYVLSNYGEYLFLQSKDRLDFMPYMDGAVISYQIQMIKPDQEIYEYLLNKYGLLPEECVFIDDRPENVEAAKAIGMSGIQFVDYEQANGELEKMLAR